MGVLVPAVGEHSKIHPHNWLHETNWSPNWRASQASSITTRAKVTHIEPSRLRMKIQDALRVSTSCVSIAIDSEAKTVAAKSEFSQCTSLYISGNGSDSEDH